MSNFVELILQAALSKESTNKINNQIKNIQKDLKDITIDFNVNNKGSKGFSEMENQIKSLQSQIKKLESQLVNVGEGSSRKKNTYISGISEEAIKASKDITDLKRQLTQSGYAVKVEFEHDANGVKKVKNILADIKNEAGKLETLKIKPVIDESGKSSFSLYGSVSNDKNAKGFIENQNKAIQLMEQLGRQGKLTAKDIEDYSKRINKANDNTNLQRTVDQMKELSKISASDNKHLTATKNLNDQANKSLEALEKVRKKAIEIGADTKQVDSLISKMRALSKIEINNDAQIGKADKLYSRLSSRVSDTKNNVNSLITAQSTFKKILDSTENKGVFNGKDILNYRATMDTIVSSSGKLEVKLNNLRGLTSKFNTQLAEANHANKMDEGMVRARLEAEKLNAQLQRTINSYKRTVNMDTANSIKGSLNSLSRPIGFVNDAEIKKHMSDLKAVEMQIKRLNSESVVGARNSMGVIESFKVAMERFPIWMAASTLFFGAVRTSKEFVTILVDIDTKLVNISKVLTDNADMGEIFDNATNSADTFAQSISGVLDALTTGLSLS